VPRNLKIFLTNLYFQSTLHSVEVVLKVKCTRRASLSLTLRSQEDSEAQEGSDQQSDSDAQLAKLAQEGGVGLMNYLLTKAVADKKPLLNTSSPREWTFRDILRMPNKLQEEWKKACLEELESL